MTWGPDDTANLGLVIGDSASQALAEFLTVFLAVVVWRAKLAQEGFAFQVRSDSTAALSATDKLAGKSVVHELRCRRVGSAPGGHGRSRG